MAAEIITKEDLDSFKADLIQEIREILNNKNPQQKEWLKSPEVRKLLKISPGTLQNLRINGTLRYTRLGSIIYYREDDIQKILEEGMKE
jgi:hypothetical protein